MKINVFSCDLCSSNCNIVKDADILEGFSIPDVTAVSLLNAIGNKETECDYDASTDKSSEKYDYPRFSMSAGDFCQVYGGERGIGQWDAVVTCFFIDTAPVVLE